jgi:hypothetical protein
MLSVVLYGFLALKKEYRLGVFEDRILRKIFGPKGEEIMGETKKKTANRFHDLLSLAKYDSVHPINKNLIYGS